MTRTQQVAQDAAVTHDLTAPLLRQEPKILARFGFLYKGYSMPYWEAFEMVRKLLISAIPVFVPTQPFGSTQVTLQG